MACLNPFLLRLALQTNEGNYNEYLLHTSTFPAKSQGEDPEEMEPCPDWYINRQNNAFEVILEYFDKRKDALENANWTCSPFSFMCCLAMVVAGETTTESEGTTTHACEDCKPFCFPYSPTTTLQPAVQLQALQQFAKQLTSVPVCRDANILLQTSQSSETAQKYRGKLVEYFKALCYDTNQYQAVNNKVQEITTIPNVLNQQPEGTCVINCVYLKDQWRKIFDKKTKPVQFTTSKQGVVVVDMMETTQSVEFVKHTSMFAVCLPYTTRGLRAWFVKGNTAADADTAVHTFLAYRFGLRQLAHQTEKIVLQIPKIKLKNKIDLKDVLRDRSTSIFTGGNLLNMSGDSSEFINKFEQHCFLDVDQEGTTAGAVTVMSALRNGGGSIKSVTFACTFFMLIEYENTLLFASKIDNPSGGNHAQGSSALKDSDFDLSKILKVEPSFYALEDLSSQTDLHSKSLELTVLAAKKECNLRIQVTEKVDKDAIEYDFEDKNEYMSFRKVLLPQPGGKTYPVVVYQVKPEMLFYVYLQNLSDVDCDLQFVYWNENGEEEEEIETAQKKGGNALKTPYPLQKDAGENPDGWLIKDMLGDTVLGITFELPAETGK